MKSVRLLAALYSVPATRGGRVIFTGNPGGAAVGGVITGAMGGLLLVRLDGQSKAKRLHPLWRLHYVSEGKS